MKKYLYILVLISLCSCKHDKSEYEILKEMYSKPPSEWVRPFVEDTLQWKELGVLPKPIYPNEKIPSKELIYLGKQLFFDARLSQSGQIACVSCHHPDQNYTDNRRLSIGHNLNKGKRNSPSVMNLSYSKSFFWDGRASSLEEQVIGPFTNEVEMNTPLDVVVENVNKIKGYRDAFKKVLQKDKIAFKDIAYAIATFERSLVSRTSKFDKFLLGKVQLSERELKGLHLFRTKGRCMNCHNGALFSDNRFHNIGLTYYGRKYEDLGRYYVTKKAEDVGRFKTPSLRNVMNTYPWMHHGLFDNMKGVLNMYSIGMPHPVRKKGQEKDTLFPVTSPLLKKLDLTDEDIDAIIEFLHSISAPAIKFQSPELPD
ncbi:MAG: c-type cytochrome [Flavobacteriaceae bacterium]|nr:c-type cytochrome [Flavobacteriaceae bacterium]